MFPITVTLTIPDHAALTALAAALAAPGGAVIVSPAPEAAAAPAPKPAAAPAAASGPATAAAPAVDAPTPTAAAPSPAAASAETAPQDSTAAADAKPVTYAEIKPLILKINTAKGRDAAEAALKKFGAAKGPDLKPEQYADFAAHAAEVLAS